MIMMEQVDYILTKTIWLAILRGLVTVLTHIAGRWAVVSSSQVVLDEKWHITRDITGKFNNNNNYAVTS